jgi:phosphonate transport system substrate-binding protein
MKHLQWMLLCLISLTLTLWLGSCSPQQSGTQAPQPATPQVPLRIGVLPTQSKTDQEKMIAPLEAHLEKVLGQPVEFLIAKDYQDSVDMLVDGRANALYGGVVSYFEALERGAKVIPLVAPIDADTVRPWYRSCLVVAANSSIKTLKDLKGKRVGFVNRSSTSGYLMPVAALKQEGIDPDRNFAEVVFGGTHAETEALLEFASRSKILASALPQKNWRPSSYRLSKLGNAIATPKAPDWAWPSVNKSSRKWAAKFKWRVYWVRAVYSGLRWI